MEKERLVIKNFGPIKSVDLELGKMTILIGDQATGKSTIAKVLAVCRYFSAIVDFKREIEEFGEFHTHQLFQDTIAGWGMSQMLSDKTAIKYTCHLYSFEARGKLTSRRNPLQNTSQENDFFDLKVETKIESLNADFSSLISQMIHLRNDDLTIPIDSSEDRELSRLLDKLNWEPNENFFRINVKKVMKYPLHISEHRGVSLFDFNKPEYFGGINTYDQMRKVARTMHTFDQQQIKPLSLEFQSRNKIGYIKNDLEDELYPLHFGASGYQSAVPITLSVLYYSLKLKKAKTFIIEEPEISLFPTTQKKLMEFFVENINNHGHSFLIPTHSPYILSSLNDLLLAHKRGQQNEEKVIKIIKKESWLNLNDLSVYELKEGKSFDILDKELGLISENIIDDVSDEMSDEFDNLMDI